MKLLQGEGVLGWIIVLRVTVSGSEVRWEEVSSGAPQGSVLVPQLFSTFTNDLGEGTVTLSWGVGS